MSQLRFGIYALVLLAAAWAAYGQRMLGPPPAVANFAMGHGPTVMLVHGLGSRMQHWLPVARVLSKRHRVVFAELPGHGLSPLPEPFNLERAARSLEAAIVEQPEPVILVGHSLGGLLATAATLRAPERVRGLVLVEAALRPQFSPDEAEGLLAALETDYQNVLRGAYESFGRDSAQGAELYEDVRRMPPDDIKPWIRLAMTATLSDAVARLETPVLAVLSDRSWAHGEAWADVSRALGYEQIRRLTAARIEMAGHFVMLDDPDEVAALIAHFAAWPEGDPVAVLAH